MKNTEASVAGGFFSYWLVAICSLLKSYKLTADPLSHPLSHAILYSTMTDSAVKITGELLTLLSIPFTDIKAGQEGDVLRVDVITPETSRLIGWHGETLNAVQHIVKSVVRTQEKMERAPFIVLDTDGYRREQEETVCRIAEAKADFVRRTGARVTLPPMSPYFRRIVHTHVSSTPSLVDLTTESVGEGDYRQIVIRLKEEKHTDSGEELSPVMATDDGLENLDV